MTFAATSRGKIALWGAVLLMMMASGSAWAFTATSRRARCPDVDNDDGG
jgi:hypothetical protein